jgi:arginase family enzyme
MVIRNVQRGAWPEGVRASRAASLFRCNSPEGCAVGLLGLPDDTGVRLNGGRPGAAEGPGAFRAALARYGAAEACFGRWPGVFDAGDVVPGGSLGETHTRVTEAATDLLEAGLIPVAIGGGHDLTFPFVRAVAARCPAPLIGVYFDAHLDVREEEGSGMPFRRLVERCGVRELHVHGLDAMSNTGEHLAWFQAHGGRVDPFGPGDEWPSGDLFVSLDLDVIDQAYAPGVSAMNPCGWTPETACRWARSAGRCERVRCFDLMELSPPNDAPAGRDGRTARLAARLFLEFLRGVSERRA